MLKDKKIYFILLIVTFLLLFKVYIANQIYILSRNIQKLQTKVDALKEERSILKLKVEKLKYKTTIVDPLYTYLPTKEELEKIEELKEKDKNNSENKVDNNEDKEIKKLNVKDLFKNIDKGLF